MVELTVQLKMEGSARALFSPSARALRVLVVDDDAKVRDILSRILQRAGHSVTSAASGEEALARFAPRQYDLVFTDLSLAGMGGEAFLREARDPDPRIIAVILAGWGRPEDVQHSALGAAAVVAKPFTVSQILQLLSELPRRDAV